jgi:hypothetical protein
MRCVRPVRPCESRRPQSTCDCSCDAERDRGPRASPAPRPPALLTPAGPSAARTEPQPRSRPAARRATARRACPPRAATGTVPVSQPAPGTGCSRPRWRPQQPARAPANPQPPSGLGREKDVAPKSPPQGHQLEPQLQATKHSIRRHFPRWRDPDSNRGHHDFQSCRLASESDWFAGVFADRGASREVRTFSHFAGYCRTKRPTDPAVGLFVCSRVR